jgi:hypothetical protein
MKKTGTIVSAFLFPFMTPATFVAKQESSFSTQNKKATRLGGLVYYTQDIRL